MKYRIENENNHKYCDYNLLICIGLFNNKDIHISKRNNLPMQQELYKRSCIIHNMRSNTTFMNKNCTM